MELSGKGLYAWKLIYCDSGDPRAIAERARSAGLTHIMFKIADGVNSYNVSADVPAITAALRDAGVSPWGWQYIYLNNPVAEANKAADRMEQFGLDGFVIDAEGECKGKPVAAKQYMARLRNRLPTSTIYFSSYRFPQVHPEEPWEEFLEKCDGVMPQVYWQGAHNPKVQLAKSIEQYDKLMGRLGLLLPYFPTGAAYREHGWRPTPDEVLEFMNACKEFDMPGFNFWEYWHCTQACPELWPNIRDFVWQNYHIIDRVEVLDPGAVVYGSPSEISGVGNLGAGKQVEVVGQTPDYWETKVYVSKADVKPI